MMFKDYKVHVPMIYVKDRCNPDIEPWLVGSDSHDFLEIENGEKIVYTNMQTSESSRKFGDNETTEGYDICNGTDYGDGDLYVKMVPWDEAIEIYKKLDAEYQKAYDKMQEFAKKIMAEKKVE